MAIIKASLKFEGAETGQTSNATPYIQENVRKMLFNKSNNQQGAYLYFLPAYKADAFGNGVWYKAFEIRDNFGDKYKEKYFVANREDDPADYFARNYKMLYNEDLLAESGTVNNNGKQFKKYPNFGRVTKRQIFNVAYANNLGAGVHVLDIPSYNGASQLHEWQNGKDISGSPRGLITDPERALPVFVQLKDNSANPWYLNVEATQPVILPEALVDSDNLYNLDDILVIKPKEDIIAKLRDMYSSSVFEDCMNGYPGLRGSVKVQGIERISGGTPQHLQPKPAIQPATVVQKAQPAGVPINTSLPVARPAAEAADAFIDPSELPPNPMARMSGSISKEEAMSFLAK